MNFLTRRLFLFESHDDDGGEIEPIALDQIDDPVKRAMVRDARRTAEQPEPEVDTGTQDEEPEVQPESLYLGKFKTEEDAKKAHSELEAFWHEYHDKVDQLQPQDDGQQEQEDPFAALREANLYGFQNQDPSNYEELSVLMGNGVEGARAAASFILRNHEVFEERVRDFVLTNWAKEDPVIYSRWFTSNALAYQRQQLMQELTPAIQDVQSRGMRAAYDEAKSSLAEFEKYEPAMKEAINTYPNLFTEEDVQGGHESIVEGLKRVYIFVRGQELVNGGGTTAATTTEPAPKVTTEKPAPARVRTTTRTNTPRGSEQDETTRTREQGIRSLIRDAL